MKPSAGSGISVLGCQICNSLLQLRTRLPAAELNGLRDGVAELVELDVGGPYPPRRVGNEGGEGELHQKLEHLLKSSGSGRAAAAFPRAATALDQPATLAG